MPPGRRRRRPCPPAAPEATGRRRRRGLLPDQQPGGGRLRARHRQDGRQDGLRRHRDRRASTSSTSTGAPKGSARSPSPEGYDHQLLLYKGRLLVASGTYDGHSILRLVDVPTATKPAHREDAWSSTAALLAERRTKGTVRVVLNVTPRAIAYDTPVQAASDLAPRLAARAPRIGAKRAHAGRLQAGPPPAVVHRPGGADRPHHRPRPGLDPVDADAVMTGGGTVYASAENLYVATQRYAPGLEERTSGPEPEGETTPDPPLLARRRRQHDLPRHAAASPASSSTSSRCPSRTACCASPRPRRRRGSATRPARARAS